MAAKNIDYIQDDLLCFFSSQLFQIPVLSFMENNCLIFDASIEDCPEYRDVHVQYRKIVGDLLQAYGMDTGLSDSDITRAMKSLGSNLELKRVFQDRFEQVLAVDDFTIFVHLMINKNLELQRQALMLISMMQGHLPSSLQDGEKRIVAVVAPSVPALGMDEDEILKAVLEQSKKEFEALQSQSCREEEEYKSVLKISKEEVKVLENAVQQEQAKLSEAVKSSLRIGDGPSTTTHAGGVASLAPLAQLSKDSNKKSVAEKKSSVSFLPPSESPHADKMHASTDNKPKQVVLPSPKPLQGTEKGGNSRDAAAEWLKTAEKDVKPSEAPSQAVYAAAASMGKLSEEELQKRAEFLKQQRDKLLEMKRREREKQLNSAVSGQSARPTSARVARSTMQQIPDPAPASAEPSVEDKKLAMRKAIASQIKSELMGKK